MDTYYIKREVNLSFNEAVEKAKNELKKEGFGVLTTIDVQATLKNKLDVDFDDYIILGACNPPFAHKALIVERDIGVLLPCNVTVYTQEGKVFISAMNPLVAMSVVKNDKLKEVAGEVDAKLRRAVKGV